MPEASTWVDVASSQVEKIRFWTKFMAISMGVWLLVGCHTADSPKTKAASGMPPDAQGSVARMVKPEATTDPGDSTKEMADLLQSVALSIDPRKLTFAVNAQRAELLHELLLQSPDFEHMEARWMAYAEELLDAGQTQMALDELTKIEQWLKREGIDLWKPRKQTVRMWQAIGYLRMAEEQNCCAVNTPDSCLVPIQGTGIHSQRAGSERAMELLKEILREDPDDQKARWLLTIAAMTLGSYPQSVPEKWRIAPKAFQSEYDIKRFPNIGSQLGLDLLGRAGGAVVDDLDGDGYLDIMISGSGFQDQLRFFHNNGDATFTERTKEAKLLGETGGLNLIQTDYNNDGHIDILVIRGGWMGQSGRFPSSLLRNNGDGTFTDVTKQAGLMRAGPTQTAVWFDYNNDGWLDLYVGYELDEAMKQPCALYRNNKDGTFTDVAAQAGVNLTAYVKGVTSADYDQDGWPDLFLSSQKGTKTLYHNNGNGTFTDVTASAGVGERFNSFGTFFFDYDNDGWADLFVMDFNKDIEKVVTDLQGLPTGFERAHLYRNNHNGTFTDVSHEAHIDKVIMGMGLNYGDLDNDGYLDIYVGTGSPDLSALLPNRMFRNAGGKVFQEVTTSGGFGHLQKGHGVAFADINNDGSQDVFEEMGGAVDGDVAYSALFANPGHGNHWITLKLEGVQTNRAALGARIKVTVRAASGSRDIYRTVGSGASFGCNPYRQEIGLGQAQAIEKVEITWPVSRKTQVVRGLKSDGFYSIREDRDQAIPTPLKATPWKTAIAKSNRKTVASVKAN